VGVNDLFIVLASVAFLSAAVVALVQKSYVSALFCIGVFFVVFATAGFITN
jgi:hypothetical protein